MLREGLRILDFKPSDTGLREQSDPMDVGAVNSLSSVKGEWSSSPRDGCSKCGGAHFQRDCNASKHTGKQSSGKGKQSKSWRTLEGMRTLVQQHFVGMPDASSWPWLTLLKV